MTTRFSLIRSQNRIAFRALLSLISAVLLAFAAVPTATAQESGGLLGAVASRRTHDPNAKMLVNAREMVYDYKRNTVSAVGDVQLYYDGSTLQADRVVYDQKANKVFAYGNVRVREPDGNILNAESAELTDDLREGFVQSLLIETPQQTRFAAASARRTEGNTTVFEKGVYTACKACEKDPSKPPLWQIKAARIIHDEKERMVYYEDARLEFMGVPMAYLPFFQHPDPTVKRKTGFLAPHFMASSEVGLGVEIPFFWNIAPNMDLTIAPVILSRQGPMLKTEFRHRLLNGAYDIRAAGLVQADQNAFPLPPTGAGDREARGTLQTTGHFDINEKWSWGWDVTLLSDRFVLNDYDLWNSSKSEAISTLYLTGLGERNYFDLRGYHFTGLSRDDEQNQLPVVAPLLDYNAIVDHPVLGGELAFNLNTATIHRSENDFEPTTAANTALTPGGPAVIPGNFEGRNFSCVNFATDCIARGVAGTYTRISADSTWKRQIIDPIGQVWTPFAFLRGDLIWRDPENSVALANFMNTDPEFMVRGMAGVGLEYRYPFVAVNSLGTHVLEPVAQLLFRPNETRVGELPNEDSQSLFFDDTNLLSWDKFSGWDRVEGGSRANIGLQYTLTMDNGAFVNAMVGQSLHLFGRNSFASADMANTGLDSGLETDRSDYVARIYLQPIREVAMATRFRFDEKTLQTRMVEVEGRVQKGPVAASLMYGRYDAEPRTGFSDVREGVLGNTRLQLTKNVFLATGARYDLDRGKFDATQIGIGYLDECFGLGVTYATDWTRNGNKDPVQKVMLRFALRTLGDGGLSNDDGQDIFGMTNNTNK